MACVVIASKQKARSDHCSQKLYRMWRPQRDTRRAGVLGLFEILRMPINQVNPGSPSSRGRFRCTSIDPVIPPEREKSRDDRPRKVPRLQQASERPHIQPTLRRIFATAPHGPAVRVDPRPGRMRARPAPGPRVATVTRSPGRSSAIGELQIKVECFRPMLRGSPA